MFVGEIINETENYIKYYRVGLLDTSQSGYDTCYTTRPLGPYVTIRTEKLLKSAVTQLSLFYCLSLSL